MVTRDRMRKSSQRNQGTRTMKSTVVERRQKGEHELGAVATGRTRKWWAASRWTVVAHTISLRLLRKILSSLVAEASHGARRERRRAFIRPLCSIFLPSFLPFQLTLITLSRERVGETSRREILDEIFFFRVSNLRSIVP